MKQVAQELLRYGHRANTVSQGPEALALVSEEAPDVLVVGEWLPPVPGVDLIEAVRRSGMKAVGVVFLTGKGADGRASAFGNADIDAYVYWDKKTSFWQIVLSVQCVIAKRNYKQREASAAPPF